MRIRWYLLIFSLSVISFGLQANVLPVVLEQKVHDDYQAFLDGRDPLEINDYSGFKARRSTVEIVLLQQAFALGGMPVELDFFYGPAAERMRRMVMRQDFAMLANTVWLTAVEADKEAFWISDAFIRRGEFEAGLYTVSTRTDLLSDDYQLNISELSAVSSSQWLSDWQTLTELPLTNLVDETQWRTMVEMVGRNRVDFLLAPFQVTDDLSFKSSKYRFYPIPKVKVGLSGSRHFVLSKNYENSEALYKALNRGIAILRQKGTIERALRESGFLNAKVIDWRKIN
ncbi:hypothetical protein [Vibrio sonorensis]|uniref:hypothetical protein n=1 Tax=Vibrio sonorensis TaxID=1004316 RepID=UPI0008D90A71|nr:hypothetical protein [Vibrio sonorensis]